MRESRMRHAVLAAACAAALGPAACSVDVREDARDTQRKAVDIRTPVGAMSVRTSLDAPDTGLAVYPGATPLREEEPESADVSIGTGPFALRVVATKFTTSDGANAVLGHYRTAMQAYGDVVECRGEIDFRGPGERPVCKGRFLSREMQLGVGSESRHRVVSVKPRRDGAEFAVVYIEARS